MRAHVEHECRHFPSDHKDMAGINKEVHFSPCMGVKFDITLVHYVCSYPTQLETSLIQHTEVFYQYWIL